MKPRLQFTVFLSAVGALLAGAATASTPLAQLPLKASVLAKPNVILGVDDSGSMDGEIMLYTNDGALWWNFDARTGWGVDAAHPNASLRSITSMLYNGPGEASRTWRKIIYLFPNRVEDGGRVYSDTSGGPWAHYAAMPTSQLAFLRWSGVFRDATGVYRPAPSDPRLSPIHNSTYYNPLATYQPWAPAQLSSGPWTPQPATPTAARSHPLFGTASVDLTQARPASTADGFVFVALPGMVVPAGAQQSVCNDAVAACGPWGAVGTSFVVPANTTVRVAMAYYAPTFWVKEDCTPENSNVATDTCTTAPDGSRLKRYEIRPGVSFPSGRSYAQEMQNFANWFQYHRKRKLLLAGAMGATLENLSGLRVGMVPFNNRRGNVTLFDADAPLATENRFRVSGAIYEINGNGGTPTREVLRYIGDQYARTDTSNGSFNVIQYACQRNNAFIVTDGFATNTTVTPPPWDAGKSAATWGGRPPFSADFTADGILADLALRYYTNNPRPDLRRGAMPASAKDPNPDLHMNTYGLSLGARGTLFLDDDTPPPTTSAAWPIPNQPRNPASVDDLWRATLSSRGKMYFSRDPESTAQKIRAGFEDILSQQGAQGGLSVSTVNLRRGDGRAYLGTYNPAGWTGDLEARAVNVATGQVGATPVWRASTLLAARPWTNRVIASWASNDGVAFTETAVGSIVNPGNTYGNTTDLMAYLRGDRSLEGQSFRIRSSLLGAVINAEPALDRDTGVVYLNTGEGMLHAFETRGADAGKELWAYVPGLKLGDIGRTSLRGWSFRTQADGTPVIRRTETGKRLLISGLGVAGKGYFAIDVTQPRGLDEAGLAQKILWEFPRSSDATTVAKMGQTVGRPAMVRLTSGRLVALLSSGFNNTFDGKGRLWMLDAESGEVLQEYVTGEGALGAEAGFAQFSPYAEADGTVRYVYGGDLLGNVWRFDLSLAGNAAGAVNRIARLVDEAGLPQPVTSAPELVALRNQRVLLVGTGRLLDIRDFGASRVQSFYALADGSDLGTTVRGALVRRVLSVAGNGSVTGDPVNWATQRGWYMDLPAGEQVNLAPTVAYGAVAFVSNSTGTSDCSASARLTIVDVNTGRNYADSALVSVSLSATSNVFGLNGVLTQPVGGGGNPTVPTPCFITTDANGRVVNTCLPPPAPPQPQKNSWREIRR